MLKTSGSRRSTTCSKSCLTKPSTTGKWLRSTNEATPLCTPQRLALVHFLRALTGVGIVASPALAGVATVCGIASVGFTAVSKRLERKVTKHEKIYTLALAKRNSVNELVSKALADKQISDVEFHIISHEVVKYHELKAAIRAGVGQPAVTSDVATQTQAPDLEKLKEELRNEVKLEFQKKVSLLTAVSKSDLNG